MGHLELDQIPPRSALRRVERFAGKLRHSRALGTLDPVWDRIRPTYDRFLRIAGKGTVVRRINGDASIAILVRHRDIEDEWEPDVWRHLMARLAPGDVFVDVGAHVGLYAIAAARRVGSAGEVHAFEPDPDTVRSLAAHTSINGVDGIVRVHARAAGDHTGTIGFDARHNTESAVAPSPVTPLSDARSEVALTTLDDTLGGVAVSVMKIDVEGYECHVLRGARNLLADENRAPRTVYIEMHPFAWPQYGVTFEDISDLLESAGYQLRRLDGTEVTTVDNWCAIVAERTVG